MSERGSVPTGLRFEGTDPDFAGARVLFRRRSANVRLTVFDGGHEVVVAAALRWLAEQKKPGLSETTVP
jgi:hypothetical protein